MLNSEIKDFAYHEFKTDSDNFVKDMSKMLSLGILAKEVRAEDGSLIKPVGPSIEYNWNIVSPAPNFALVNRPVTSVRQLSPSEYETVTLDQIRRITNKAVIKCTTLSTDRENLTTETLTVANAKRTQIYFQMYMPKYLCDTEVEDPFVQEDGVTIPLCINPKNGKLEAKVRNYHWCLFRLFDNPNADFSGPLPNKTDLVTGELLEFNSASSEWAKLSWFTDFEELFLSEMVPETLPQNDKILRVPVNSSLTNKTKIRIMANFHPNRLALSVVGNPNVDYEDNRYLISSCYVGAIDSFQGSKQDIEGNFGIYTSSSSVGAIPSQTTESTATFSGLDETSDGLGVLPAEEKWKVYNQTPAKVKIVNSPEQQMKAFMDLGQLQSLNLGSVNPTTGVLPGESTFQVTYKKREIPADKLKDLEGGRTTIVDNSVKVTLGNIVTDTVTKDKSLVFNAIFEYGSNQTIGHYSNKYVEIKIPAADLKTTMLPVKTTVTKKEGSLTEFITVTVSNDGLYKLLHKYIEAELATRGELSALTPGTYPVQQIRFSGIKYAGSSSNVFTIPTHSCLIGFDEQGVIRKVVNKSERDKYGNLIAVNYPKTFGKHTANCTTDFAMYKTDSADFWQSHFLMFSSTEQFMKKHMYGKSVYTNEYFADRIKVTHSAEGVRGVLSGLIVIDAESLFAFDELIVNKDFTKDNTKPEETYVYLPITATYCPFANSPNERNGLGLLKELKYSEHNDDAKCEAALIKLAEQYVDSLYYTNGKSEVELADVSYNGLDITWTSSDAEIVTIPPTV
jgi:hypothetical protein